jgi:hypothetical protein
MSDFDQIRNMGLPDYASEIPGLAAKTWQLPGGDETDQALRTAQDSMNKLRDFGARSASQQKPSLFQIPEGIGSVTITRDETGKPSISAKDVAPELIEGLLHSKQKLDEIMGSFHQEAQRLQQQEQQTQSQPWMQLATALSANMAQARDMPGWVQALGRTAAQMNPSVQELQARRMQLMGQEAQIAEKAGALDIAAMRTQQEAKKEERAATEARIRDLVGLEKSAEVGARKGEYDPYNYFQERLSMGDSPQTAAASANRLLGVANDAKLAAAAAEKSKQAGETAKELKATQKEIAQQNEWNRRHAIEEQDREKRDLKKEAETAKKDEKKRGELGTVLEGKVEDILTAKRSTNRLLEIFDPNTTNPEYKHFQEIVGPVAGRIKDFEKWVGTLNATDAQLVAKINMQFANAVKTLGAGSYGYRISERGFLQSFTEAMKNSPSQNYGNLLAWSTFYYDKIESFKDIKDKYDWSRVDTIMATKPGQPFPERTKPTAIGETPPAFPWKKSGE